MAKHLQTGKRGELLALHLLREAGYHILDVNWRYRRAEVDLIAEAPDGTLVFVEVKTRSTELFGSPESFVTERQQQFLIDAAGAYMREIGHEWAVRFDVVAVVLQEGAKPEVRWLQEAFFG